MPVGRRPELMAAQRYQAHSVMRAEEMVGIISRSDILCAIAASVPDIVAKGDEALRRAILAGFVPISGSRKGGIEVTIENGTVSLSARSKARLCGRRLASPAERSAAPRRQEQTGVCCELRPADGGTKCSRLPAAVSGISKSALQSLRAHSLG